MREPAPSRLRQLFDDGGVTLMRKINVGKAKAGDRITGTNGAGYLRVRVDGVYYLVLRLLWVLRNGPIPDDQEIDHKNGATLDNSAGNLRLSSHNQNMYNRHKQRNNSSGHPGVSMHKPSGKWVVQMMPTVRTTMAACL